MAEVSTNLSEAAGTILACVSLGYNTDSTFINQRERMQSKITDTIRTLIGTTVGSGSTAAGDCSQKVVSRRASQFLRARVEYVTELGASALNTRFKSRID